MAGVGASGRVDVLKKCLEIHCDGCLTEDKAQTIVRSAVACGKVDVLDYIWRTKPAGMLVLHNVHHQAAKKCHLGVLQWLAVNCPMMVTPCSGTVTLMHLAVSRRKLVHVALCVCPCQTLHKTKQHLQICYAALPASLATIACNDRHLFTNHSMYIFF
jgi:hypothetical protein